MLPFLLQCMDLIMLAMSPALEANLTLGSTGSAGVSLGGVVKRDYERFGTNALWFWPAEHPQLLHVYMNQLQALLKKLSASVLPVGTVSTWWHLSMFYHF